MPPPKKEWKRQGSSLGMNEWLILESSIAELLLRRKSLTCEGAWLGGFGGEEWGATREPYA
ncbi:hypothetical protein GmHk_11G032922 [Glycine max]|nr:hypothetical protein GmHk_11G032922 [Glycine max]